MCRGLCKVLTEQLFCVSRQSLCSIPVHAADCVLPSSDVVQEFLPDSGFHLPSFASGFRFRAACNLIMCNFCCFLLLFSSCSLSLKLGVGSLLTRLQVSTFLFLLLPSSMSHRLAVCLTTDAVTAGVHPLHHTCDSLAVDSVSVANLVTY